MHHKHPTHQASLRPGRQHRLPSLVRHGPLLLALGLALSLTACSSKEEKGAKLLLKEILSGCMQSGAPKQVCTCLVEEPDLVESAKLVMINPNDDERRITFMSQAEMFTRACVESELGIPANRPLSQQDREAFDRMLRQK